MYKSTFYQIILFTITAIVIFQAGKYIIELNDLRSFTDGGVVMLFFISFILFINYLSRLTSKLIHTLGF
ncbi:hypothetical protein [Polaribacter porphyrae]|uniref:hypothetical protein n=1 Tax=Polaribacter porphyrae TaxID=1137780 RepID=UPI0011B07D4E|nr:hypothetical protein [Polaribacter porphyrae]